MAPCFLRVFSRRGFTLGGASRASWKALKEAEGKFESSPQPRRRPEKRKPPGENPGVLGTVPQGKKPRPLTLLHGGEKQHLDSSLGKEPGATLTLRGREVASAQYFYIELGVLGGLDHDQSCANAAVGVVANVLKKKSPSPIRAWTVTDLILLLGQY